MKGTEELSTNHKYFTHFLENLYDRVINKVLFFFKLYNYVVGQVHLCHSLSYSVYLICLFFLLNSSHVAAYIMEFMYESEDINNIITPLVRT